MNVFIKIPNFEISEDNIAHFDNWGIVFYNSVIIFIVGGQEFSFLNRKTNQS